MNTFNNHLNITDATVLEMLKSIDEVPLVLAELPLEAHPMLPHFNRSIQVHDIDAKSGQEFVYFNYRQVLRDKITGEVINITLPTPEWVVYAEMWSYLRDGQNRPIPAPITEGSLETEKFIRVPRYKYMLWLMHENKVAFLDLIKGYLYDFSKAKKAELDKL